MPADLYTIGYEGASQATLLQTLLYHDVETLLDIRNLRIEAMVFPPGEPPKKVTIVDDVSLTLEKARCWA